MPSTQFNSLPLLRDSGQMPSKILISLDRSHNFSRLENFCYNSLIVVNASTKILPPSIGTGTQPHYGMALIQIKSAQSHT